MSDDDLPANETVRIITGITGVMHSPKVIEGETSSSGKTISVEATQTRKSYRLDTAEILAGESEYRKSTYFEIYTPKRLRKRQRANRAPGPQAGCDGVSDADDLPEPTHVPDGETAFPEPDEEPDYSDERSDDGEERDDGGEGADADTDPLEMADWSRADVLAVEGVGELLVVKLQQTRTSPPTTTGANAVDRAGEKYKIRVFDGAGAPMLVVEDASESKGVVMLDEADKFPRSMVAYVGRSMDWLRRHIGGGGDGSGDGDGGGVDDDPDEPGDGSSGRHEVLADGGRPDDASDSEHPAAELGTIRVNPDDVVEAIRRNKRDEDEQRSHDLRVTPPLEGERKAKPHVSEAHTRYPPEMSQTPLHIGPEAFIVGDGAGSRHPDWRNELSYPDYGTEQHLFRDEIDAWDDDGTVRPLTDDEEDDWDEWWDTVVEMWENRVRNALKKTEKLTFRSQHPDVKGTTVSIQLAGGEGDD